MSTTQQDQRYQYAIDPKGNTTANKVLNFVGREKKVLELGCGPGAMTRYMREQLNCQITALEIDPERARLAEPYCDKLYVTNLESFDFKSEFAEQRFDVIVAADVLEHLQDPWRCLCSVRELLQPEGYIVVSIPNVAHNSVIAQLLVGRFSYQPQGLLDVTHLRFFTRRDIEALLLETGFFPEQWQQNLVPEHQTEFAVHWHTLPDPLKQTLSQAEDGQVYQYIVKALPSTEAAWLSRTREENSELQRKTEGLEQTLRTVSKEREEYIQAFHEARDLLEDKEAKIAEYAQAFHEARNTLEKKDKQINDLNESAHDVNKALNEVNLSLAEAHQKLHELELERTKLGAANDELVRMLKPLPVRAYWKLRRMLGKL